MTHSYDELLGGSGARVYFRPDRFRPSVLARQLPAELEVAGEIVPIHDLSMGGLAYFLDSNGVAPRMGARLSARLSVGSVTAFSGSVEVVRAEPLGSRLKVAVKFVDAILEPARLRSIHDELVIERDVAKGVDIFSEVPKGYKAVACDAVLFLNHWRRTLDRWESQVAPQQPTSIPEAGETIEAIAERRMRREWVEIGNRAAAELGAILESPKVLAATKRYSETLITPELLIAPIWRRAYMKPRGYPGDYGIMNYMYEDRREGESAFARILHQLGKEERLSATVPRRKDFLLEHLTEIVSSGGRRGSETIRVATIGAGPAREIEEFLESGELRARVSFLLIDQDEEALRFASERVMKRAVRHGELADLKCRFVSFKQVLARKDLLAELGDHDLIYSAGLFDYLSKAVATELTTRCFESLRPGGRLLFGNAANDVNVKWVPELLLDWHMNYRTEEDMRDLASEIDEQAKVEIQKDSSGAWFFLVVRRR